MDSSDRARDHLRWQHIEGAVLDVYYENLHREVAEGCDEDCKARADTWGIHSQQRASLLERTRQAWMARTSKRVFDFPYSEDYCCSLYFKFRKRNQEELKDHYSGLNRPAHQMF